MEFTRLNIVEHSVHKSVRLLGRIRQAKAIHIEVMNVLLKLLEPDQHTCEYGDVQNVGGPEYEISLCLPSEDV